MQRIRALAQVRIFGVHAVRAGTEIEEARCCREHEVRCDVDVVVVADATLRERVHHVEVCVDLQLRPGEVRGIESQRLLVVARAVHYAVVVLFEPREEKPRLLITAADIQVRLVRQGFVAVDLLFEILESAASGVHLRGRGRVEPVEVAAQVARVGLQVGGDVGHDLEQLAGTRAEDRRPGVGDLHLDVVADGALDHPVVAQVVAARVVGGGAGRGTAEDRPVAVPRVGQADRRVVDLVDLGGDREPGVRRAAGAVGDALQGQLPYPLHLAHVAERRVGGTQPAEPVVGVARVLPGRREVAAVLHGGHGAGRRVGRLGDLLAAGQPLLDVAEPAQVALQPDQDVGGDGPFGHAEGGHRGQLPVWLMRVSRALSMVVMTRAAAW